MNFKLADKRETLQVQLRSQHINSVIKSRREQLQRTEIPASQRLIFQQSSPSEILRDIYGCFQQGNFAKIERMLQEVLQYGQVLCRRLAELGLLSLLACVYQQVWQISSFQLTILKTLAYLTNLQGLPTSLQSQIQILLNYLRINNTLALQPLQYIVTIYANCCLYWHHLLLPAFHETFHELQKWFNSGLLDSLTKQLMCFFRCYLQFCRPEQAFDEECQVVLKYCFYVLTEKFQKFLYESQQVKVVQDTLKIMECLVGKSVGSVDTVKYPYRELVEILQLEQCTAQTKRSVLIILGESFYQSDNLALKLIRTHPILPSLRNLLPLAPALVYQVFANLALLSELSGALEGICHETAIKYLVESDRSLRVYMFTLLRNYVEAQEELPIPLLKIMADTIEETVIGEEVRFWAALVCSRGYKGRIPSYVLREDGQEAYQMRKVLQIE